MYIIDEQNTKNYKYTCTGTLLKEDFNMDNQKNEAMQIPNGVDKKTLEKPFTICEKLQKPFIIKPFICDINLSEAKGDKCIEDCEEQRIRKETMVNPIIRPMEIFSENEVEIIKELKEKANISDQQACETVRALRLLEQTGAINDKDKSQKLCLNFEIKVLRKITKINDSKDGELESSEYEVKITVFMREGGRKEFTHRIKSSEIKDAKWLQEATEALASKPRDKHEKEAFENCVQNAIEAKDIANEVIYPTSGWRKMPDGKYRYIIGQGIVGNQNYMANIHTMEDYKLECAKEMLGTAQTFRLAMGMCDICKNKIASTELFVFFHTALMRKLFEIAGFDVRFIMAVLGQTNSRKTSMVVAMMKLFNRNKLSADAQFVSTGCGIEKTLGLYGDAVVIIDDFKPAATKVKQSQYDDKLEYLVRFYGDGVEKRRMTEFSANNKNLYFPIRGCCVITGEIISGITSSLSRMFITEIEKDYVDNDKLTVYQTEKWILPTHTYDFLYWLTENFDKVVSYIKDNFDKKRKQYRFEFGRYCEMYATLTITAEIIGQYAMSRGFFTMEESNTFAYDVHDMVLNELHNMERRTNQRDVSLTVLLALREFYGTKEYSPTKLDSETCALCEKIYEDDKIIYMQMEKIKELVEEYIQKHKEDCGVINKDIILNWLKQYQLVEGKKTDRGNEYSRKLPIQKGNTRRYCYISKKQLEQRLMELPI